MKQSHVIFVAIASVLTILFSSLNAFAEELVGDFSGEFDVRLGQAGYTIPIEVAKGAASMQPSLALVYNSGGGNGPLGRGWSLSGLSAISRCPQTIAQDGQKRGVRYNGEDRFCLDGQRLVAVKGEYGEAGSEYRTELDSYSRITAYGQHGSGPAYWKAETKAGLVFFYGETENSKLIGQRQSSIHSWNLNRTEDLIGNKITYFYHNRNQEFYLSKISYADRSVNFVYEDRLDKRSSAFNGGTLMKSFKRLKTIQSKIKDSLFAEYRLTYQNGRHSRQSQLTQVVKCHDGGKCFKPVSFEWSEEKTDFGPYKLWYKNSFSRNAYPIAADANGQSGVLTDISSGP